MVDVVKERQNLGVNVVGDIPLVLLIDVFAAF